jgi:hypothetical protein
MTCDQELYDATVYVKGLKFWAKLKAKSGCLKVMKFGYSHVCNLNCKTSITSITSRLLLLQIS